MHGSGYLDYTVETHASRSMKVMDEFRRQEMLCDLVLHVTYKEKTVDFKVKHPLLSNNQKAVYVILGKVAVMRD